MPVYSCFNITHSVYFILFGVKVKENADFIDMFCLAVDKTVS